MSKAYDLITESLNEIITDLEEKEGKNLKREIVSLKIENKSADRKKIGFTGTGYIAHEPIMAKGTQP